MRAYVFLIDQLNRLLKLIMIIMFGVMLTALFLQIVSRFIFNFPLSWSEELARYLTVWMVFLGAGIAVRNNKLIKLDALVSRMSHRQQLIFLYTAAAVSLVFYIVVIAKSFDLIKVVQIQKSPAMSLPMSVPYLAIPVGSFFMLLNTFAALIDAHRKGRR